MSTPRTSTSTTTGGIPPPPVPPTTGHNTASVNVVPMDLIPNLMNQFTELLDNRLAAMRNELSAQASPQGFFAQGPSAANMGNFPPRTTNGLPLGQGQMLTPLPVLPTFGMGEVQSQNYDRPEASNNRGKRPAATYPNNIPLGGQPAFVPTSVENYLADTSPIRPMGELGGNQEPWRPLMANPSGPNNHYTPPMVHTHQNLGMPVDGYNPNPNTPAPPQGPPIDPDILADMLRDQFGLNVRPTGRMAYQKPYPEAITRDHPLPRGFRVPDFATFSGEDDSSTIEHIGRFTAQLGENARNPYYKMQLFSLSLTKTAFSWFANLPPGHFRTWENMEGAFHTRFFNPVPTVSVTDIVDAKQLPKETVIAFIERVRRLKSRCSTALDDSEMTKIVVRNMAPTYRKQLTAHDIPDLSSLASKAVRLETLFKDEESANHPRKYNRPISNIEVLEYSDMEIDDEMSGVEIAGVEVAEQAVAELVKGKPFPCPKLQPNATKAISEAKAPQKNGTSEEPMFDVSKADEIFDVLLKEGQLRLPRGQRLATAEEIKGRSYCKMHNSFTHTTAQCHHFKLEINKALRTGRLKFFQMGVDEEPFPSITTAMVQAGPSEAARPEQGPSGTKQARPQQGESHTHPSGYTRRFPPLNNVVGRNPSGDERNVRQCHGPSRWHDRGRSDERGRGRYGWSHRYTRSRTPPTLQPHRGPIAQTWTYPDGTYEVQIINGAMVWKKPTRRPPMAYDNIWINNAPPPPVDVDPRFPGMMRTQIRRAKRQYAATHRGSSSSTISAPILPTKTPLSMWGLNGPCRKERDVDEKEIAANHGKSTLLDNSDRAGVQAEPQTADATASNPSDELKEGAWVTEGLQCAYCERVNKVPYDLEDDLAQTQFGDFTPEELDALMVDEGQTGNTVTQGDHESPKKQKCDESAPNALMQENKASKDDTVVAMTINMAQVNVPELEVEQDNASVKSLEEPVWAHIHAAYDDEEPEVMCEDVPPIIFEPLPIDAPRHLKPLYVQAHINGRRFNRVFVDNGAVYNIIPLTTLKKIGKTKEDLAEADLELAGFNGHTTKPLGMLTAQIGVGPKVVSTVLFVVDTPTTYSALLGRDWIHTAKCVPSTLHQKLLFWEGSEVITVNAHQNPFQGYIGNSTSDAVLYESAIPPISMSGIVSACPMPNCKLTRQGYVFY